MNHVETVQTIYQDFGRGDVPAILDRLADDVQWDMWEPASNAQDGTIPYALPRKGKDEVVEFFEALGALEFHAFEPRTFTSGDDTVMVRIHLDITVKATGKRVEDDEIHVWTFGPDGKVTAMRHVMDTLKHYEANRG